MPHRLNGRAIVVFLTGLVAFALAILPVVFAALTTPPGYVFSGFLFNPMDSHTYLAKMYTGWAGGWRYTFPYTAQETQGAYLFLLYPFLGHAARLLGLPLVVVFHLARAIGSALLLLTLLAFFRRCLPDRRSADLAFILAALGSGMGWLAMPAGAVTTDLWVAEAYPFLSMYSVPHFSLGLALLTGLLWLYAAPSSGSWARRGLAAAGAATLLGLLSPFGIVIVLMASGALFAWEMAKAGRLLAGAPAETRRERWARWREWLRPWQGPIFLLAVVVCTSAPVLVYYVWASGSDPVLVGWHAQNITRTPPFWDLLLAFSPALLLALPAVRQAGRAESRGPRLLAAWLVTGFLLLLLPFGLQRRFIMGLFVPVAGLAGWSLSLMAERFPQGWKRLTGLALVLPLPTLMVVLMASWYMTQTLDSRFYLTESEYQALAWLEENAHPEAVVLSSPEMGTFVPAYTGARVIYGHLMETVDAGEAEAALMDFFLAGLQADPAACAFLAENNVAYIFFGARERSLGGLPADCMPAEPVFTAGDVMIYQLER